MDQWVIRVFVNSNFRLIIIILVIWIRNELVVIRNNSNKGSKFNFINMLLCLLSIRFQEILEQSPAENQ